MRIRARSPAQWMADRAAEESVPFSAFLDLRADHLSILTPLTELIAKKIGADTGPAVDLHFTQQEIDGLDVADE